MNSLVSAAQQGGMTRSIARLSRSMRAGIPLSICRNTSRHYQLSPAIASSIAAPSTAHSANQRRSFFFSSSKTEEPPAPPAKDRLRHIHIPYIPFPVQGTDPSIWTYSQVEALQAHIQRIILDRKAALSSSPPRELDGVEESMAGPWLVTFTSHPAYTLGRRQAQESELEIQDMIRPRLAKPVTFRLIDNGLVEEPINAARFASLSPDIVNSPRGGLTTYHGPGQLICWPILDIHSPGMSPESPLGVRTWAALLENVTSALLRERYSIDTVLEPENPGVWSRGMVDPPAVDGETPAPKMLIDRKLVTPPRKIASIGLHLRRHVSTLGVSINISSPFRPARTVHGANDPFRHQFGDQERKALETSVWARIVACGQPGRSVTSVIAEYGPKRPLSDLAEDSVSNTEDSPSQKMPGLGSAGEVEEFKKVADEWARKLADALGIEEIDSVEPRNVPGFALDTIDESLTLQYNKQVRTKKPADKKTSQRTRRTNGKKKSKAAAEEAGTETAEEVGTESAEEVGTETVKEATETVKEATETVKEATETTTETTEEAEKKKEE